MKGFRKFLIPLTLLFLVPWAPVRADMVDDLKADVLVTLPLGSHVDKVRQFLKVRKFKISEVPKQKSLSGRLAMPRGSTTGGTLVVTFQFDDEYHLTNVSYDVTPARS